MRWLAEGRFGTICGSETRRISDYRLDSLSSSPPCSQGTCSAEYAFAMLGVCTGGSGGTPLDRASALHGVSGRKPEATWAQPLVREELS